MEQQVNPTPQEGSTVTNESTVQTDPAEITSAPNANPIMEISTIQPPDVETQQIQLTTTNLTVKSEITAGDFLVSTLLAVLIVLQIVTFFHKLILGRKIR